MIYLGSSLQQAVKVASRVALFTQIEVSKLPPLAANCMVELGQHYWAEALGLLLEGRADKVHEKGFSAFAAFHAAGRLDMLTDLLRVLNRRQRKYLEIEGRSLSHFYNSMMTLMDAAVYFSLSAWADAAGSLLLYLQATVSSLKL